MNKDFIYFIEMVLDDETIKSWRYELKCNEETLLQYIKSWTEDDLDILFERWRETTEDQREFLKEDRVDSIMLEYEEGPIKNFLTNNYKNSGIRLHFDNWRWHTFLDTEKVSK